MPSKTKKVVVGYDGSDASQRALSAAVDLMRYGSTLTVVVVRPADAKTNGNPLDAAREQLFRRHIHARYVERVGEPAAQLLEAADELSADLLVVGRKTSRLGTADAAIVRDASCDVLVVL